MANFPIPTSGTAWASGGISGRVGSSRMRKPKFRKRSYGKKPWEQTNWVPYMGDFNNNPWLDGSQAPTNLILDTCGTIKRVVMFQPHLMNQDTMLPTSTGRVATESSWKVRKPQGHVFVSPYFYDENGTWLPDQALSQASVVVRLYWSWIKERVSTQGYQPNIADTGVGPSVLSGISQLTNKHLLNWGVMDIYRPNYSPANALFTGGDAGVVSHYVPAPRMPKAGLRLGVEDQLSLVVQASYHPMYSHDTSADFTNSVALPMPLAFKPFLRFPVSA